MMRIKPVRPANGNGHHRMESLRRIVLCVALTMLMSAAAAHGEQLLATTKLSLSPLPAPTATATDPNHFALAIEPRPKSHPAPNGISAGSSDATRRVLAAATFLNEPRIAAKGSLTGLFSSQIGDRGFRIANIQLGYGMVCMDPVFSHGRNGTAMEDPSYMFVKTSRKF